MKKRKPASQTGQPGHEAIAQDRKICPDRPRQIERETMTDTKFKIKKPGFGIKNRIGTGQPELDRNIPLYPKMSDVLRSGKGIK